jgi:hypothetical protein
MMSRKPPLASLSNRWDGSNASYLKGRSHLDGVDQLAVEMERTWGVDRLRLLVPPEWREKFDRQRVLFNAAINGGTSADIELHAVRMTAAWVKLDALAKASGALPLAPEVWEFVTGDGTLAAIVKDAASAHRVVADDRHAAVYTLDEIGRLLLAHREVLATKLKFPGATVTKVTPPSDPLDGMRDGIGLDDWREDGNALA